VVGLGSNAAFVTEPDVEVGPCPAPSTVSDLLARRGLVQHRCRRHAPVHPVVVRPDTAAPNDLWTADFKGQSRTGIGLYCYPLTIADQHTRYLLVCHGLLSTEPATARPVFERAFRAYGLPVAIRTDNGAVRDARRARPLVSERVVDAARDRPPADSPGPSPGEWRA